MCFVYVLMFQNKVLNLNIEFILPLSPNHHYCLGFLPTYIVIYKFIRSMMLFNSFWEFYTNLLLKTFTSIWCHTSLLVYFLYAYYLPVDLLFVQFILVQPGAQFQIVLGGGSCPPNPLLNKIQSMFRPPLHPPIPPYDTTQLILTRTNSLF